ncbi:MAG: NAD-dependent epimerase/dehydratase family protein [Candidatus Neomarinimicrobiota bacterium]|nr:MAG: NAD-dependent epimerase/dehydratase family protein [bacterium]|tara:strand:+ start:672 stop:1673 length:1002 start_codon:yes stop_codon:yes gene_type:complete
MKKILVTGGTSYIGKHCIAHLLEKQYDVKATIRDIKNAESVKADLQKYLKKDINLKFFEADLLKDNGWDKAIENCDAIMHVAGPYPMNFEGPEEDQIKPHEEGTLRILKLAKSNNVQRVVLTSSIAAVWMGIPGDKDLDESKWTNEKIKHIDPYIKSKTIKEKAAWEYVSKNKSIKLTTILPPVVLGPGIGDHMHTTSMKFFNIIAKREMPIAPPIKFGMVDVRDVAKMHVAALEKNESIGKRFIVSENTYWAKEFANKLIEIGYNAPTFSPPAFIVKFMTNFDKTLRMVKPVIGLDYNIDSSSARSVLGFDPIPFNKTVLDTSDYVKSLEAS